MFNSLYYLNICSSTTKLTIIDIFIFMSKKKTGGEFILFGAFLIYVLFNVKMPQRKLSSEDCRYNCNFETWYSRHVSLKE